MRILVSGSTWTPGNRARRITGTAKSHHRAAGAAGSGSGKKSAEPIAVSSRVGCILWDPIAGKFDAAGAEGADAVVHLAGASIADGRWNAPRKQLLRTSRIDATRHLISSLGKLQRPPRVIVAASAIGFYGSRGDETLTEESPSGNDFLAGVCREWEAEAQKAAQFGARVVNLRTGIVLAGHGGALPRIVLPFKLGAGGRLGNGRQWMSWITLRDAVKIMEFAISNGGLTGAVNVVTPNPVRNAEFTRVLAMALHRPALFPAPAFALRLALGEMADALLLSSQKAVPSKLEGAGFTFSQPVLAGALAEVLQK